MTTQACAAGHSPSSTAPEAPPAAATAAPAPAAPFTAAPPLNGPNDNTPKPAADEDRDIVKTASLTLTAVDTTAAADKATAIVTDAGGRVDSRSEDAGSSSGRAHVALVLRVPVAKLDKTLTDIKGLGTVNTLEIKADDVTNQRVDLDARITALQTSVDRLLGIMRDAKDPDALIKAENALSQRQADLDSLRAQRAHLGEQIAFSTLNLDVYAENFGGPIKQYHGFFGQVERGWDGMVGFASGAVMLFGLLLPWLAALALAGGVGYAAIRLLTRRH
ncbi:hypothetical protein BST13_01135 [Mycobacterium aquaticum]|uniref:DUF4349 domain-containing protein n=1 Tax=Mycobacterium aquaticum TaxID=1927124 RepID=A0A1X0BDI3_9MYCO|nr:hypothetical protein BST13_01135 [Mycobacterium aquaticum]